MDVTDGRGLERKRVAAKNIEKVRVFFEKNPGSTQAECCKRTKLSKPTVSKAIKKLTVNKGEV